MEALHAEVKRLMRHIPALDAAVEVLNTHAPAVDEPITSLLHPRH